MMIDGCSMQCRLSCSIYKYFGEGKSRGKDHGRFNDSFRGKNDRSNGGRGGNTWNGKGIGLVQR
eukprot:14296525-Ditylum_brightwellii.AAC.1